MRVFAAGFVMSLVLYTELHAQTMTPDMMAPTQGGFRAAQSVAAAKNRGRDECRRRHRDVTGTTIAPSRINATPVYDASAASGASDTGFDSLNRIRKKPKPYPGAPKPKFVGPGNPQIEVPPPKRAETPVPPAVAGTVAGQPPRRRLKYDDDPFGPTGFYTGTFLTKAGG